MHVDKVVLVAALASAGVLTFIGPTGHSPFDGPGGNEDFGQEQISAVLLFSLLRIDLPLPSAAVQRGGWV